MGHEDVFCAVDMSNESTDEEPRAPLADRLVAGAPKVAVDEAFALVGANRGVIVDLANSKVFRREHIRAAQFCERSELPEAIAGSAKELTVIITSRDGRQAAVAAADFVRAHRRVVALQGGTAAWQRAGYPLESGKGNLPEKPNDVFYRPYDLAENREKAMQDYLDWEKDLVGFLADEPGVAFRRLRA
jgi:rhodanese-related sulfurtransferase